MNATTCDRCLESPATTLHTSFGLEHLCIGCRDAVRRDGQEIAAPYPLSLEDFAAYQSWREYIRLAAFCIDMRKALLHRLTIAKQNAWLVKDGKRTEWTAMVERWHQSYIA